MDLLVGLNLGDRESAKKGHEIDDASDGNMCIAEVIPKPFFVVCSLL